MIKISTRGCLLAMVFTCATIARAQAADAPGTATSPAMRAYGKQVFQAVSQQIAADAARNEPLIQHYFGITGTTMEVAFIVAPSGQVVRDRVLHSSGDKQFDATVLRWSGMMKLPPFPSAIHDKQMTFAVPYFFRGQ